jgi:hypothetical protein
VVPAIKTAMAEYGYDDKSLAASTLLVAAVKKVYAFKISSIGMQKEKSLQLETAKKAATRAYQDLSGVLKALYRTDRPQLDSLGIKGAMPSRTNDFITAAYTMFDNALNTTPIRDRLAGRGYPATKLASERTKIVAFDGFNKDQEIAKGANILATQSKNKEVKPLFAWYIYSCAPARPGNRRPKRRRAGQLYRLDITVQHACPWGQPQLPPGCRMVDYEYLKDDREIRFDRK